MAGNAILPIVAFGSVLLLMVIAWRLPFLKRHLFVLLVVGLGFLITVAYNFIFSSP